MNVPNSVTLARILLLPFLIGVYYLPQPWAPAAASAVFGLAALTDWLDGYLARRLGQTSAFGAFLDPVADKLMVAVALVLLVQGDPRPAVAVAAAIIIGREIAISALREIMAVLGKRAAVAVATVGKVKTTLQMVAILLMLYRADLGPFPTYDAGLALLFVAAGLTLWSMVVYLRAAWPIVGPRAAEEGASGSLDSGSAAPTIRRSTPRE